MSVTTQPAIGIGQRALLVSGDEGNVLWDCTVLGQETFEQVAAMGGLSAIAISHPHFYSLMVEWSAAFGGVPIYLHADDRQWVMRPDPCIVYWQGERLEIAPGLTLIRCGGHFTGGTVLHWAAGCEGRGAILSGDIVQVVQDRRWMSFMYSYPNLIPLDPQSVRGIVAAVEPYDFDRLYAAWPGRVVMADAQQVLRRSAERYIRSIAGPPSATSPGDSSSPRTKPVG